MRALVTGSVGFFGGILKDRLLSDGWEVVGVDRLVDAPQPGYAPMVVDIRDAAGFGKTVRDCKHDVIFHCAAVIAHDQKNITGIASRTVNGVNSVAESASQA